MIFTKKDVVSVSSKDVGNLEDVIPGIVEAVGVSVAPSNPALKDLAKLYEKAMSDEVLKCISEGVTDPVEQKKRMMAAHARIEREWGRK